MLKLGTHPHLQRHPSLSKEKRWIEFKCMVLPYLQHYLILPVLSMQKLVDKYILQHFASKVITTIMAFIVIFLLVDIVDHLDHIIDSEMPSGEIIRYYYHTVPWYFSLGLPMSLLLATIFTFGILQKNNELSALKASGVSIRRLSVPLLILGLLFSVFSFYFDNLYVTEHLQKRNDLGSKYHLIRSKAIKMKNKDIFRQESNNEVLGIKRYEFRNKTAHNISIQKISDGTLIARLDAPIMKWNEDEQLWILPNHFTRSWTDASLKFYNLASIVSWFTRNTKNWHIVYNWLPYSKPIERDALCPDVHVADFQTFKKRKQSCLTFRMVFQYPKYVRTWEYIQINTTTGRNRPFPVYLMFFPETLFGRSAVINAKLIT